MRGGLEETGEKLSGLYEGQASRQEGKPTATRLLKAIARRGITLTCVCVAGESQWVLRALPPLLLRVLGLLNLPVSLYTDLVHPGVTEHPQPRPPAILLTG